MESVEILYNDPYVTYKDELPTYPEIEEDANDIQVPQDEGSKY